MVNAQMIIELLTNLAPQSYAYEWDNVGVQAGSLNAEVNKVLVTLDINFEVLKEAEEKGCNMIISHHPVIFDDINSINDQNPTGKLLIEAIKKDILLYSAHTNLDVANGGLNDYLGKLLKIKNLKPLSIKEKSQLYKLVVFGPKENLNEIREKILKKGAGNIGNYSNTSFSTNGEGTFKAEKGSNPYIGKKGKITEVEEFRFETIVKENDLNKILKVLNKVHPYEEVAYDLFKLENNFKDENIALGRIGKLKNSKELIEYANFVKEKLNLSYLKYHGKDNAKIKKIAFCSGSGADLIAKAKYSGADLYITGDVKYHEAQYAEELNLNLIDAGHYGTESIVKDLLFDFLNKKAIEKNYNV
ncbi:MAG: Nif3-like dinuclear metal center hexameric protein, partial [Bacillota bacterium]